MFFVLEFVNKLADGELDVIVELMSSRDDSQFQMMIVKTLPYIEDIQQ